MRAVSFAISLAAVSLLLGGPGSASAQDKQTEVRPEGFIDTRAGTVNIKEAEGEQPIAGYERSPGNGFFVQSSNGEFRLQLGGYTQVRWNANWRTAPEALAGEPPENDFTRGWSLNRTRLFLEGKFTDRAAYHFRVNIDDSFDVELLVAFAQLRLSRGWSLRFGKMFIPLSREDWMFAQDLLTSEYSPNDFTFAIGPSLGAFAFYGGDRHRVWIALHNGAFGGREPFPSPQNADFAGTARWEWNFVGDDWSVWDDMVGRRGRAKVMMLGLSGGAQGKFGSDAIGNRSAAQGNIDLNFNGSGFQAVLASSMTFKNPVDAESFVNFGLMAQVGAFVLDPLQLFTQYNLLSPGTQGDGLENFNSLALGINYFPFLWTNRWKLTLEGGVLFNALSETLVAPSGSLGWLASDEGPQGYLRVQAQFGF